MMAKAGKTFSSISPYAILTIFLLFFNAGFLWLNFQSVVDHQRDIARTHNILHQNDVLLSSVKDAETSLRGYLLTKDPSFHDFYQKSRAEVLSHFHQLRELTKDNSFQLSAVKALESSLRSRLEAFENTQKDFRAHPGPHRSSVNPEFILRGRAHMQMLRNQSEAIRLEEEKALLEKSSRVRNSRRNFLFSLLGTTVLSILVIGGCLAQVWNNQKKAQRAAFDEKLKSDRQAKVAQLSQALVGSLSLPEVGREVLLFLSRHLKILGARFYLIEGSKLSKIGDFGVIDGGVPQESAELKLGSGLAGEAALKSSAWEISDIPPDYFRLSSGLGNAAATYLCFQPIQHEQRNIGLLELATFSPLSLEEWSLLDHLKGVIADGLNSAQWKAQLQNLLSKTQKQSIELQSQQEELRSTNEELEQQAEELRNQQDELRATNENLEQQTKVLEDQKAILDNKNKELEEVRSSLEQRAAELVKTNQYKSEFLARMSHELRTPLNSLLILTTLLIENKENNLTERQLEFAKSISGAGYDLLGLINDILDLSKIEAKKLVLRPEAFAVSSLCQHMKQTFELQFKAKGLEFSVRIGEGLEGQSLLSDRQRIEQVLRNLLSNALKFTEKGSVRFEARRGQRPGWIRWEVADSGIGIPEDKKELIFDAFEQVDSSVSRKYGGTGLGLAISKELAELLGGFIEVKSEAGRGSVFSFEMPMEVSRSSEATPGASAPPPGRFLERPSEVEGLAAPLASPGSKRRKVLVVEDNDRQREALMAFIAPEGLDVSLTKSGQDAFRTIKKENFDCLILDLELPDMTGFDILEKLEEARIPTPPVIIYTGREVTEKEEEQLRFFSESIIIKGARSPERLIEELRMMLQGSKLPRLPVNEQPMQDRDFSGKTILLVDDDLRNVFALTNGLESWGLNVRIARNGVEALQALEEQTDIQAVLMDLMMPKMDGYEAIRRIRKNKGFTKLPVIALTAKAAPGSREKVLEAGASDYLAKPIHLAKLRSVLRVWLGSQKASYADL